MLATFIIGLREGLEAALIVGIIAAFLARNGKSLAPMWIGVAIAIILSIAVGVALALVEKALPQAAQEAMETVIGAIAVIFVTGMVFWMNNHARDLKRSLEAEAAEAIGQTGAVALASMAFLAVLREGFETSVFLLATFSAAQSTAYAAIGAVSGILLAILIGWGIYIGGVKLNLSRFFRITGAFLILVAAGLVLSSLRTAHEAGWLNAGQQATVNLTWLVAPGTIRSALLTGVLGIPADPRLIEVIGWLAYLVPVGLIVYWPAAHRPNARLAAQIKCVIAACLLLIAAILIVGTPYMPLQTPVTAPFVATDSNAPAGSLTLMSTPSGLPESLTLALGDAQEESFAIDPATATPEDYDGLDTIAYALTDTFEPADRPDTLDLNELVALGGGRLPTGISPGRNPGPFTAEWSVHRALKIWTVEGRLLDASTRDAMIVTLSGGGLQTPRSFTARNAGAAFSADPAYRETVKSAVLRHAAHLHEYRFWARFMPAVLLLAAVFLVLAGLSGLSKSRKAIASGQDCPTNTHRAKGTPYVTHS
ncbi:iron uptake transporter permease EfeU [Martelella sp. HB161492]|uniref:iron uptake transporter permease EfeU n=1 Tax=Martelella sp. HB161492 TaxID=2720726 RepID=UPI001590D916|nr:iron uptake transporter permease EfeU [Martelella sp. HB161492]